MVMKRLFVLLFFFLPTLVFAQYSESETKLSPGDVIEIRFFYTPELNIIQTIRPDGKIYLQLIGEVTAKDRTPLELENELRRQFSRYFKQLDIAIFVNSYSARHVYVGGQVNTPGIIQMPRSLTVLEAIMLAGGIDTTNASYQNVVILRYENGKWNRQQINLEEVLRGSNTTPTFLKPLDIVYVPERISYK